MKPHVLYYLLAAVMLMGFYSCKKGKSEKIDTSLVGVWVNESAYSGNLIIRQTFQFSDDGTVGFTRVLVNKDTRAVLGYNYKSTAKFTFDGNTLKQYDMSVLSIDQTKIKPGDPYYTPLADLIPYLNITSVSTSTVSFNADKTVFNFIYVCPLNADCIGLVLYTKQ
ncbi:MAG: hypothetical protein V4592_05100 [Bacteroidota bacterium]